MSAMKKWQHLKIGFEEIERATNNFETCIGKGGYGWVYKGQLNISGKLTMVAVKRFYEQFGQGLKEFLTELDLLFGQQHPNLISLLGYCDDLKEKIIVYQYAERGSLDNYIRPSTANTRTLSWRERLKISVDAASGLDYLHHHVGQHQTIIHRDIKSANILLDENLVAKISDLGLSKLSLSGLDRSLVISHACGTPGYCEPEYIISGIVTKKSDVYSFGMVLFEVLCGKLCTLKERDGFLLSAKVAKQFYEKKKLVEIVDPNLREHFYTESMTRFSAIAYKCLHNDREQRPSMDVVKKELDKTLNIYSSAMSTFGTANASAGPSIMDRFTPAPSMIAMNVDNRNLVDVKPRIGDESMDKSRIWKLTEITEPSQCRSLRLPDTTSSAMRVSRLVYTNSGLAILALAANAVHKLWKWQRNDRNSTVKATASVVPQLWQPTSGILMTNVISDTNPEEAVPCFALAKNDSYVMSASGGKISLFNMMTFKTMTTFMPPPPAATFLTFHPQDNNIIAIGMEDSSIQIYNVRIDEVKTKLKGHNKRITGLAFSKVLNVLVSSGADSQLCVWSTEGWEKLTNKHLQIPPGRVAAPVVDTRVQFHNDQTHLLVVHETQIAVYEAPKLEHPKQWVPPETSGLITHATFSCDSHSVYVSFEDGSVGILTASTLRLRCRISSTSYLPSNPNSRVYPLVIAAHPTEANQFALGLTDGGVVVLEPQESEGKWDTPPPPENGAGPRSEI